MNAIRGRFNEAGAINPGKRDEVDDYFCVVVELQ